jgi:hypothetical protein
LYIFKTITHCEAYFENKKDKTYLFFRMDGNLSISNNLWKLRYKIIYDIHIICGGRDIKSYMTYSVTNQSKHVTKTQKSKRRSIR